MMQDMNGIRTHRVNKNGEKVVYWRDVKGNDCSPVTQYSESTRKDMLKNLEEAWADHKAGRKVRYKEYLVGIEARMKALRISLS